MCICVESAIARLVRIGLIGSEDVVGCGGGVCRELWLVVCGAAAYRGRGWRVVGGAWRVVFDGWRFAEGVTDYLYDSFNAIFWG